MKSRRVAQLSAEIKRAVQEVLSRGLSDPRVGGLITVTEVRVTGDLARADILVSVLPQEKQSLTHHALCDAARHIRREAGEIVRTRQLPEFVFVLDERLKKEAAVLGALAKVREEQERREGKA
jgi:ribosome-binding factor A